MNRKKLSIIMPVYNTVDYLDQAISSVLNQTYQNIELILVDDGSSDGSEKIVDKYAKHDSRIIAYHQENHGESHARNVGLRIATGDYWTFMDCDDWLELDMYESLIDSLERNNVDVACGSWFEEFPDNPIAVKCLDPVENEVFDWQQVLYYLYRRDRYRAFGFMWDKVYRREVFHDENGEIFMFDTNLILGGDIIYLAQLLTNCKTVSYVDRCFYHYRQRQTSGSYSKNVKNRLGAICAYERVIELLKKKGAWEDSINYAARFLAFHCCLIIKVAIEIGDQEGIDILQDYMRRYEAVYCKMNAEYPERIEGYRELMEYKL